VVINHGGLLRVEDTVPGDQPPGTSIYVLFPGRPMPASTYQTPAEDSKIEVETDPVVPAADNLENSRDSANVISVDSQSARAR
jgi:two-component system, OmpR family, sensor histidine kinase MprB